MSRERFEERNGRAWRDLDALIGSLERRDITPDSRRLPDLYRHACQHLALARHRLYGHDLERWLNQLVQRGHQQLYGPFHPGMASVARTLLQDFPRAVRAEGRLFLISCLCFFMPLLAMHTLAWADPDVAASIFDLETLDEYREMYQPIERADRGFGTDVRMFGYYVLNNVSIALRSFAGGVFGGVGALVVLVYNGVALGATGGFLHAEGLGDQLFPFVIGHSSLELMGLVLAGMAGLKLGLAVLMPGRRTRSLALRQNTIAALPIIAGAATMVLLAAFVEAFWSSSTLLPDGVKYVAGGIGWLCLGLFLTFAGRNHGP